MSMVNADSVQLFAMLKKMQDSISSIETTKKSVKMKYEQLGAGWQDKKYNELGVVVRDCNKALNNLTGLRCIFGISLNLKLTVTAGDTDIKLLFNQLNISVKTAKKCYGIFHSVDIYNLFRKAKLPFLQ